MSSTLVIEQIDLLEITFHELEVPCYRPKCTSGATTLAVWQCTCSFTYCDDCTEYVKEWIRARIGVKAVYCKAHLDHYPLTADSVTFHTI